MTAPTGARISPAASDQVLANDGALRITLIDSPPGLAITGDIDEFTYGRLLSALERFTDGPGNIHVNLAGVEYCDLPGLRAIIGLTAVNGHSSRGVVLHNVSPHLNTVLRILGWDCTPGLTMDDRESSVSPRSIGMTDRVHQARS
jgi:anti-anti-sigma regulatory factor